MSNYGSLQAEFMETKDHGHIHRYGAPIFSNVVVYLPKPINNDNKYFRGYTIWLDSTCQVFFSHRKQDFSHFCCIPGIINSCLGDVKIGVIYNALIDSNEGVSVHMHHRQHIFSSINENKISDRENPVELFLLGP